MSQVKLLETALSIKEKQDCTHVDCSDCPFGIECVKDDGALNIDQLVFDYILGLAKRWSLLKDRLEYLNTFPGNKSEMQRFCKIVDEIDKKLQKNFD